LVKKSLRPPPVAGEWFGGKGIKKGKTQPLGRRKKGTPGARQPMVRGADQTHSLCRLNVDAALRELGEQGPKTPEKAYTYANPPVTNPKKNIHRYVRASLRSVTGCKTRAVRRVTKHQDQLLVEGGQNTT